MWPGHVGGLSLFNEDGLYMMLNCGSTGSGPEQSATTATSNLTGIEYFIYIDGNGTSNGQFVLSVSCINACNANAGSWN